MTSRMRRILPAAMALAALVGAGARAQEADGVPDEQEAAPIQQLADPNAIEEVKSGMTGHHADSLARTVIDDAGYGERFGHSLGHGIGLAVHEVPVVGPRGGSVLGKNMVFTIEPGIYIPGWGGVRIEDMVVLENGKVRVITQTAKGIDLASN